MEMREGYRWRHSEIGSQPALGGCNERGAGSRGEADLLSAISRSEAFRDPVRLSPGAAGTPAACGKAGPERVRRKGAVPGYQQRRQGSRSPRSCRKCTLGRSARHRGPRLTVYAGHLTSQPPRLRSEEHTSELQSQSNLVCRLLLEKKKIKGDQTRDHRV